MAKISEFTSLGVSTAPADDDLFHVADEDNKSYKMTWAGIKSYAQSYKGLTVTSFNLTAGQIATLNSSPITLFSGIASTERVIILAGIIYYNYGTSAYTDSILCIFQDSISAPNEITNSSTFENGGSDSYCLLMPKYSLLINNDLILGAYSNPTVSGDGVMELQVLHQTISL